MMTCSLCLMYGHNKSTYLTSKEECEERLRQEGEGKKAQAAAAKAQAAENVSNFDLS